MGELLSKVLICAGSLYEIQGEKIKEKNPLGNNKYFKVPCVAKWELKNRRKILFSRNPVTDILGKGKD